MCGRFVQYSDPDIYASHFELDTLCETRPRYNLAPTQPVLAIRETDAGKRELIPLRWVWSRPGPKGRTSGYSMINARAETVKSKPASRNAFQHRHCLIPTEGFYEWKTGPRGKTPFLIHQQDREPFAMAGLWERWHGEDGSGIESCTKVDPENRTVV
jgi:putative SOS response-associated peptidase YedK